MPLGSLKIAHLLWFFLTARYSSFGVVGNERYHDFFTSFTANTSLIVYGQLNYLYAGIFGLVGFIATVIGQLMMQALLTKYNRNSYIAYCIAMVVGISAVCMTFESVISLVQGHTQRARFAVICCKY